MFGEEAIPDINIEKEFESLKPGYCSSGWICEGCGLVMISKTEEGEMKVMRLKPEDSENRASDWEDY
jgi:hypothetical protein